MVDWKSALLHGFHVDQYRSPDDQRHWDMTSSAEGTSILNVDASGQYGGLQLTNLDSGETFILVLGVHNWRDWMDITSLGVNETFENAVDQYYHYREKQDHSGVNILTKCRCSMPWMALHRVERSLTRGGYVHATATRGEVANEFTVIVLLGKADG